MPLSKAFLNIIFHIQHKQQKILLPTNIHSYAHIFLYIIIMYFINNSYVLNALQTKKATN